MTLILKIFLLLAIFSCINKEERDKSLLVVDIEGNIKNMEIISLSQFTDEIHYIPLETRNDVAFTFVNGFDILNNTILSTDLNSALLYDTAGHFILKFGTKGRGPGEYQFIQDLTLSRDKKIYIKSLYDLLEYNLDGSFIKKYSNTFRSNDKYYIGSSFLVDDSLFLGHVPNSTGQMEYKALLFNKMGYVKQSYKNYILFNRERPVASTEEQKAFFYRFKNNIFYKDINNDTLFFLDDNYQLFPNYAFKLGKFKEPTSDRALLSHERNSLKYFQLQYVYQTEKYLILNCWLGDYFPAKRFTPMPTPMPTINPIWYNTRACLGIYYKQTGELVWCKPTSTDNPLFTSGLYNDIDAGPRFFPNIMINDSTMVSFITAYQLKKHIESDDFKNNLPKYPGKKKQLEEFANKLTETDNPVLMFVTFKK